MEILPDASWKRRITDDTASAPPTKKVKREPTEVSSTAIAPAAAAPVSAASSAASAPAAASGSSASAPFEIDLSLSSDEEDDAPSTTSAPAAPVPTRAQPAMLLDSEVSVLTVDSNIWETPSANYGLPRTTQGDAGHDSEGFPFAFAAPAPGERWDSFYDLPLGSLATATSASAPSGSNASGYAAAPASASGTWANQPEADLASSMAMFTRKHPNVVSNPFAQRQTTPQSRAPAPRRPAEQDPLDIICLLDSDSE